jgi:hypothetical protein
VTPPFRVRGRSHIRVVRAVKVCAQTTSFQEMTMKTFVSALLALSVLAGAAGTASAAESHDWIKDFWAENQRNSG